MRIKSAVITLILLATALYIPPANANQKPIIESFAFTPNEIDILSSTTKVDIELIVSHPSGIENLSTIATLSSSRGDTQSSYLTRTDSPVNFSLTKVTFRGSLTVQRDTSPGVYNFTVGALKNNLSAGYQYSTDNIENKKIRNLVGGEYGLLVRNSGDLNLSYSTFVGPSYDSTLGITFNDPSAFNSTNTPIWKVGESFSPGKYYELRVPSLSLGVSTSTPIICSTDGKQLKFLKVGLCAFTVSTLKTSDYLANMSNQTVSISDARIKPELAVEKIANQTAKDLPKLIEMFRVYSASEGYVIPQSVTPTVCFASGFFVRIVSGGTCTLTYQTKENSAYLASDLYKVTFEVIRESQTITFTLPATTNISVKSLPLSATVSGGGVITYESSTTGICLVSGVTLNLIKAGNCSVTATQAGTSTLAPVSATASITLTGTAVVAKKTITCIKGKTAKKVTGTNPKCPTGYKLKK